MSQLVNLFLELLLVIDEIPGGVIQGSMSSVTVCVEVRLVDCSPLLVEAGESRDDLKDSP